MTAKAMSRHDIIMNFVRPPSLDDVEGLIRQVVATLPDELAEHCEDMLIEVEDFPDSAMVQDMELDSDYDLLAFFRSGKEVAPGVQKKIANGEDTLVMFRRPILDLWCETCEDLTTLVRDIIIEELCRAFEFSEDDTTRILKSAQSLI